MNEELRSYQSEYVQNLALTPAWYLAGDPRMGKTRAEVFSILRRIEEAGSKKILVVGPKNPLELSWVPELRAVGFERPSQGGGDRGYMLPLHWYRPNKTVFCARVLIDMIDGAGSDKPVIVLINYDILNRMWNEAQTISLGDLLWGWKPDTIIVDEAHLIKTAGTVRTRAMYKIGKTPQCKWRRCLSGTPDPNGRHDIFSQYKYLDSSIFGANKSTFLKKYFVVNPMQHWRVEEQRMDVAEQLDQKMLSIMTIWKSQDYFSVEDPPDIVRSLHWPITARAVYDKLAKDLVLTEHEDDLSVDGTHKLTKRLRLSQLCSGFLVNEADGEERILNNAKQNAVVGDLDEILSVGKRAVVSFLYTRDGERLRDAIAKEYGEDAVLLVDGNTKDATERLRIFDIRNSDAPSPVRVLVVQESVGGVGISLARAEYLLFSTWSLNSATHEQMRKRVWDPGRPCWISYYPMADSVDTFARAVVQAKRDASIMEKEWGIQNVVLGREPVHANA